METTIFKYPIGIEDIQTVRVRANPKVIHVGMDPGGQLCIWAEVDRDSPETSHVVHVYGTGHPLRDNRGNHLGSVLDDQFVWHVYSESLQRKPQA